MNLFLFSFQKDLGIKYTKTTVKFDDHGEGKARFSFKIWLEREHQEDIPEIYLLISNRENPVSLDLIDKNYIS